MNKLNGAHLQDLHHYALAMAGQDNCADAYRLRERLDCADNAYNLILNVECAEGVFDRLNVIRRNYETERELIEDGVKLLAAVKEWSLFCGIDSCTGEQLDAAAPVLSLE